MGVEEVERPARRGAQRHVGADAGLLPLPEADHVVVGDGVRRAGVLALDAEPALRDGLVLTNGIFDLLHVGHVRYLEGARAEGKRLVEPANTLLQQRRYVEASTR